MTTKFYKCNGFNPNNEDGLYYCNCAFTYKIDQNYLFIDLCLRNEFDGQNEIKHVQISGNNELKIENVWSQCNNKSISIIDYLSPNGYNGASVIGNKSFICTKISNIGYGVIKF